MLTMKPSDYYFAIFTDNDSSLEDFYVVVITTAEDWDNEGRQSDLGQEELKGLETVLDDISADELTECTFGVPRSDYESGDALKLRLESLGMIHSQSFSDFMSRV